MTNVPFAEATAGQFSKIVSTYHWPLPVVVPKSCLKLVALVEPMSENGSLLIETHTRYCSAEESVAVQLNVTGFDTCAPPMGDVSVAALCASQFAAVETVKRRNRS